MVLWWIILSELVLLLPKGEGFDSKSSNLEVLAVFGDASWTWNEGDIGKSGVMVEPRSLGVWIIDGVIWIGVATVTWKPVYISSKNGFCIIFWVCYISVIIQGNYRQKNDTIGQYGQKAVKFEVRKSREMFWSSHRAAAETSCRKWRHQRLLKWVQLLT